MGYVWTAIISAIVGFAAGVFVYRNNAKKLSNIADKIDSLYDSIIEQKERKGK